jgi:phospholipase C
MDPSPTGGDGRAPNVPQIEHVVVLVLENRSYDHLLGFMPDPAGRYDGLTSGGPYTNPGWEGGPPVSATPDGKSVLPLDPDHSHDAVMEQLSIGTGGTPTMEGFVSSYERKAEGMAPPRFGGLLGPLVNWKFGQSKPTAPGCGPYAMACQPATNVTVLTTLAQNFGVCTRWFASVPGETLPNRGFLHAATSDGETDIQYRLFTNPTVFEQLEEAGRSWHIYFDDLPMVSVFVNLWDEGDRLAKWYHFSDFASHVRAGKLPTYSFIEPNHRPPIHTLDHWFGEPDISDSQHPGNSVVSMAAYATWNDTVINDFWRAELLIANVYEALRADQELFERTILLVTYDEPGGLYDHVPPPTCTPPGRPTGGWGRALQQLLLYRKAARFDFTRLGPRVPAIVISPYVPAGTVCDAVRDHAAVPATVRKLFAPGRPALTDRDKAALTFDTLLDLDKPPRTALPDLSGEIARLTASKVPPVTLTGRPARRSAPVPAHRRDLAIISRKVRRRLRKRTWRAWWPPITTARNRTDETAKALRRAAERARR